jgi:hypothetical protein
LAFFENKKQIANENEDYLPSIEKKYRKRVEKK